MCANSPCTRRTFRSRSCRISNFSMVSSIFCLSLSAEAYSWRCPKSMQLIRKRPSGATTFFRGTPRNPSFHSPTFCGQFGSTGLCSTLKRTQPRANMKLPRSPFPFSLFTIGVLFAWAPLAFTSTNLDLARQLNAAFVEVAEKISPTVVVITVRQKPVVFKETEPEEDSGESIPHELWRYFHEQFRDRPPEESSGQGS